MRNAVMAGVVVIAVWLACGVTSVQAAGTWNGWITQDPYHTVGNLSDVSFITPLKGWIAGDSGTILTTEDGGDNWAEQNSGTEQNLIKIEFINEKQGWAVGGGGIIIKTEDGGKTWITQNNLYDTISKVSVVDAKEAWIVKRESFGTAFHTQDGGKTWEEKNPGTNRAISSVFFLNARIGWVLAGEEVFSTADGGNTWKKGRLPVGKVPGHRVSDKFRALGGDASAPDESLGFGWQHGDITFANDKQGWAVVFHSVFHTEDGGKTWALQLDTGNTSYSLGQISFSDEQNGCVSGWTIYCTADGGNTWQERLGIDRSSSELLEGISLSRWSDGWVVGGAGRILHSRDGGWTWNYIKKESCGSNLAFLNNNTFWLWSRWDHFICRTDDGGKSLVKQNVALNLQDLVFVSETEGWALGSKITVKPQEKSEYTTIKHTTDGGKTWSTQLPVADLVLNSLSFPSRDNGWAAGDNSIILHTKNGGRQWERQQSGTKLYLLDIHFIDDKQGIIIGDKRMDIHEYDVSDVEDRKIKAGVILHTEDGGKHWQMVWKKTPALLNGLFFLDKKIGWVTAETDDGNVLLFSENGGRTWKENRLDISGHTASSPYFLDKNRGVLLLEDITPGILEDTMMLITRDGGKTWTTVRKPLKKNPWHVSEMFE